MGHGSVLFLMLRGTPALGALGEAHALDVKA